MIATAPRPIARLEVDVLKVGGSILEDPARLDDFARLVAARAPARALVVVHGGGSLVSRLQGQLGLATHKRDGIRVTPRESMGAVAMALRGLASATLVARLVGEGVRALGLSGVDLGLLRSHFLDRAAFGRVGGAPRVEGDSLRALLTQGFVPVIAPLCLGPDGGLLNVNADTVAHALAVELEACSLDFVSDVPGVYDGAAIRPRIRDGDLDPLVRSERVRGGMVPKLRASLAAVRAGVGRVRIGTVATLAAGQATEVTA